MTTSYEKQKERARKRQAEQSAAGRDIAPLPLVQNWERRDQCAKSLQLFCETYFPELFYLGWSADQLQLIDHIETAVLKGGLKAFALPRGSGKTCISQVAALWAILNGLRRFVSVIAVSSKKAEELLLEIKTWLETNDLLLEDYPEACYPIRRLENMNQRTKGQHIAGKLTRMTINAGKIVLPTVSGYDSSGSILTACGLTGSELRGQKHSTADGQSLRPDLVLIDDPQTRESAASPTQNSTRERTIAGDVLGMAGPGKNIAALMPCTIIYPDDMAARMLDRSRNPFWRGTTSSLILEWPENMEMWEEYGEILKTEFENEGDGSQARGFYIKNRDVMDEGAVLSWADRKDDEDVSAVQHAMNLYFRNQETFFAEYQNNPEEGEEDASELTEEILRERFNGYKRGMVPSTATRATMFIDVQGELLFHTILAARDDFTPFIVDYGAWPDQKRQYFTLTDAKRKLGDQYPGGQEARIQAGLADLLDVKLSEPLFTEDGNPVEIERVGIDANWQTDTIYSFCKSSEHSAKLVPCRGTFYGATTTPLAERRRKKGDRVGLGWFMPLDRQGRPVRSLIFDSNHWKSFFAERARQPKGDPGALTFYGTKRTRHDMLIDNLLAEKGIMVEARGRRVAEWKIKRVGMDNHLLDTICGALALLAFIGCKLPATAGATRGKKKKKKIKLSELHAQRKRERMQRG